MAVFVVGVDTGSITGVTILDAKSVVDSWQDDMHASVRRLIMWVRENRESVGLIGVEDSYVGVNPQSSLAVTRAGGFVEGALYVSGYPVNKVLRIAPSSWRAELDLNRGNKERKAKEAAARVYAKGMTGKTYSIAETHMAESACIAQVVWNKFARSVDLPVWRNR